MLGVPQKKDPEAERGSKEYVHKLEKQNENLNSDITRILDNQNKIIDTMRKEIKDLKTMRRDEGEEQVRDQIKRLEKLIEKKQRRAEEEEFHYELKRVRRVLSVLGYG